MGIDVLGTFMPYSGGSPGPGGSKNGYFWVKNSKNYKNLPENWIMGQNTPQAMGIGVLDTFMPHPGVIPGPGVSKNWYSWGKNIAIMGGCRNGKT